MLTSYNWHDAKGNTNSDSNADFQGDVIYLDPRAPNQYATQPGLIRHLAKGAGSYTFPFGLQLGGTFTWNSGTVASRTFLASGRNLPMRVPRPRRSRSPASPRAGWRRIRSARSRTRRGARWTCARSTTGASRADLNVEFFVDLFNIANKQGAIREQDLVAGSGGNAFGSEILWVNPRRAFLGARVKF